MELDANADYAKIKALAGIYRSEGRHQEAVKLLSAYLAGGSQVGQRPPGHLEMSMMLHELCSLMHTAGIPGAPRGWAWGCQGVQGVVVGPLEE